MSAATVEIWLNGKLVGQCDAVGEINGPIVIRNVRPPLPDGAYTLRNGEAFQDALYRDGQWTLTGK